jgi:FAD/FMN-containing dehydrogenase
LNRALIRTYCKAQLCGNSAIAMTEIETLESLRNLLGSSGYRDDPEELAPWLTDWRGRYSGKAAALLSPANTEEVSAIIRLAAERRVALVPQGGNSGMVAGATPDKSGTQLLLSLRRMNKIVSIEAARRLRKPG